MFNEKIKREYITTFENAEQIEIVFKNSANFESILNKDLFDFDVDEIKVYYKSISSSSMFTLNTLQSKLRKYTQWAIDNNYTKTKTNHYNIITQDMLAECFDKDTLSTQILTEEELDSRISRITNDSDKFIIRALFEGIRGESYSEILGLKLSDIDSSNNVQVLNDIEIENCYRTIKISDKLKKLAYESAREEIYQYERSSVRLDKEYDRVLNLQLPKKGKDLEDFDKSQKSRRIYKRIRRATKEMGMPNLSAKRIINSGILNMIKVNAKAAGVSNIKWINAHSKEIENQYEVFVPSLFIREYHDYLI